MTWLGPQAWKLGENVRLVEFFAGHLCRLSKAVIRCGHVELHVGWAHGQDLAGPEALRLCEALLEYLEPQDCMVAWPCRAWCKWSTVNAAK